MFSPETSDKCSRLQTFRVVENTQAGILVSDNFGATPCDKERPWFWSRAWHGKSYAGQPVWEFPVLAVIERSFVIDKPFQAKNNRSYTFDIYVLDRLDIGTNKTGCDGCAGRTINDIYEATEALLQQVMTFVGTCRSATIGSENYFLPEAMLSQMKAKGVVNTYTTGAYTGALMAEIITQVSGFKFALHQENIFGNAVQVNIPIPYCDTTEWDFSCVADFPLISGCNSCG